MKFFEKDLESLIFDDYMGCQERGLRIKSERFINGFRFRQLQLGAFGIADLVNIVYDPTIKKVRAQIIECKRGKIDASTYLQAKRYELGVRFWLSSLKEWKIYVFEQTEIVLIGDDYCEDGPIGLVAGIDPSCSMFTYKYGLNGIIFRDETTPWFMGHEDPSPHYASQSQLKRIAADILANHPNHSKPPFYNGIS